MAFFCISVASDGLWTIITVVHARDLHGHPVKISALETLRREKWHCPDTFDKLKELLTQDQFELLLDEEKKEEKQKIRLVYLMNDAVESFLVFHEARLTGGVPEGVRGGAGLFPE